jgi:hypothetical protein
MFNKYKYEINTLSKIEDRSRKLIIGTKVFIALVISSKRLDTDSTSVGPSTYSFTPSSQTKRYVSRKSIERALSTTNDKNETSQCNDFDAQIRQVRSSLVDPNTYTFARFFSPLTDTLMHRPYSIFTIKDKSNLN